MAVVTPLFFDTSVLIAGSIDFGPASTASLGVLAETAGGRFGTPLTAWHCCLEFFAVATRLPPEFRLRPSDAARILEDDILAHWRVVDLPVGQRLDFIRGLVPERVVGGRLYDAHLAEVARLAGAGTVVSENRRHFSTLLRHGIRVLDASEVMAEA
jgi:hypothetical protein